MADAALVVVRNPRALADAARSAWRGLRQGLRNDGALVWLAETRRLQRLVPGAAPGVLWSDPGVFLAALEPLLDSGVRVLEIGCGAGRVTRLVAPSVRELVAVDSSSAMVAKARRNLGSLANVRVLRNRGLTLAAIPDEAFDLVFSHDVFRQLDGLPVLALVDEARRVIRPGGHFVVSFDVIDEREVGGDAAARPPVGGAARDLRALVSEAL